MLISYVIMKISCSIIFLIKFLTENESYASWLFILETWVLRKTISFPE